MASFASRRLANGFSWSLNLMSRSRNFKFSFSLTEPTRHHRRRQHSPPAPHATPRARSFATHSNLRQEANRFQRPSNTTASTTTATPKSFTAKPTAAPPSAGSEPPPPPPPPAAFRTDAPKPADPAHELRTGLSDLPEAFDEHGQIDWARSFHGLSTQPFSPEAQEILMAPIDPHDVEVRPEGLLYLPEIKYRRILHKAFGAGGWGLAPRGETIVTAKSVTREYALVVHGRLVSVARGEQDYFDNEDIPMATEGCKSIALRRCCKDIGIASELWDPRYIREFNQKHAKEVWVEHVTTKKKRKIVMRKDDTVKYPYKETKAS